MARVRTEAALVVWMSLAHLEESVVSAVVVRRGDGFAGVVVGQEHLNHGSLEVGAAGVTLLILGNKKNSKTAPPASRSGIGKLHK